MAPGSRAAKPSVSASLPRCGENILKPAQPGVFVGVRQGQQVRPEVGLPGSAYLCYFEEEVINEILGRAGVEGGLMVADAAVDEVLQAPVVPEKASVRPGQPVH